MLHPRRSPDEDARARARRGARRSSRSGRPPGKLTDEEVEGALGDIDLTHEQIENVYAHFAKNGIEIVERSRA